MTRLIPLSGSDDCPLAVYDFGQAPYEEIWRLQQDLVSQRAAGDIPDTLLLGEHLPIITQGRGSHPENLLAPIVPVVPVERGGDVTYHGPGQLVGYPIVLLPPDRRDLHQYLRHLEDWLIRALATWGVVGERNPGKTGVWVRVSSGMENEPSLRKIASIGVAVRRWVTYHGFALNVSVPLADFAQIRPCGLPDAMMTRLHDLLPESPPDMAAVKMAILHNYPSTQQALSQASLNDVHHWQVENVQKAVTEAGVGEFATNQQVTGTFAKWLPKMHPMA